MNRTAVLASLLGLLLSTTLSDAQTGTRPSETAPPPAAQLPELTQLFVQTTKARHGGQLPDKPTGVPGATIDAGTGMGKYVEYRLSLTDAQAYYNTAEYARFAEYRKWPTRVAVLTSDEASSGKKSDSALALAFLSVRGHGAETFLLFQGLAPDPTHASVVADEHGDVTNFAFSKPMVRPLSREARVRLWEQAAVPTPGRLVWALGASVSELAEDDAPTSDHEERLIFAGGAYQFNPYMSIVGGLTLSDLDFAGGIALDSRILGRIGLGGLLADK
jgi:hypothetical protein